jgi:hypothetical protein
MGETLYERGRIEGDEIEAMCEAAYGRKMAPFMGWIPHWPPTMAQIRAGAFRAAREGR